MKTREHLRVCLLVGYDLISVSFLFEQNIKLLANPPHCRSQFY